MDLQQAMFAPGWFWSMLGIVLVVGSLFGLTRQLRSQGAANAVQRMEVLEERWGSPRMLYQQLELLLYLRSHPADLTAFDLGEPIIEFFSTVVSFERRGYVSFRELSDNWGFSFLYWWDYLKPAVEIARQRWDHPGLFELEPDVARMEALATSSGIKVPVHDGLVDDRDIQKLTNQLRRENAWKSGQIPSLPADGEVA